MERAGIAEDLHARPSAKSSPKRTWTANRRNLVRSAVVAIAIGAGAIAWVTMGDSGVESEPAPAEAAVRVVSEAELREAATTLGQPIYWAGPVADKELELTELGEGGGTQVRYLPAGAEAGEGSPESLTVGSYPLPDPTAALEGFAKRPGAIVRPTGDGGNVVTSEETPTSVYFASPDNGVQVEVYDPSSKRAMSLARSGTVQSVG